MMTSAVCHRLTVTAFVLAAADAPPVGGGEPRPRSPSCLSTQARYLEAGYQPTSAGLKKWALTSSCTARDAVPKRGVSRSRHAADAGPREAVITRSRTRAAGRYGKGARAVPEREEMSPATMSTPCRLASFGTFGQLPPQQQAAAVSPAEDRVAIQRDQEACLHRSLLQEQ